MDKEISHVVNLAVTLIALSVVVYIVIYTVYVGNDLKLMALEKTVDLETSISTSHLGGIVGGEPKIMPKASLYYILAKEGASIDTLYYDYKDEEGYDVGGTHRISSKGGWTTDSDPDTIVALLPEDIIGKSGLCGKVEVITERAGDGEYNISIYDIDVNE